MNVEASSRACDTQATNQLNGHLLSTDAHYRPEIDGLRGIAILAVLLHHVDPHLVPGGYVGVDVFFVISGYLITSIVTRDLDAGRFSFRHFYARRAKRLIPAATVLVVLLICAAWWFFLPQDFQDLGASVAAYTAMLSNVLFWRWDDYFAAQNKVWPLLHTWSLAIEEQFYLVYPLLLWSMTRFCRSTGTLLLGALALSSFALSEWQAHAAPRSAYYLLPGRAWELLAGALCSRIPASWCRSAALSTALGAVGTAMMAVPIGLYSEATRFPGIAALPPVAGTAMLLHAACGTATIWSRLLQSRLLVTTGLVSYSLYLWHWPLIVIAKYPWSAAPTTFPSGLAYAAGLAAVFVALLSYRHVEAPCRRARVSDRAALLAAGCVSVMICLAGIAIHRQRGVPSRLQPSVVAYANGALDFQPRRRETIDLSAADIRAGRIGRLGLHDPAIPLSFVLWGDSHADSLVPVLDSLAAEHRVAGIALTKGATLPVIGLSVLGGRAINHDDCLAAAADTLESQRIPHVIMAAHWSGYLEPGRVLRLGNESAADADSKVALMKRGLQQTLTTLRAAGARHVWIIQEVPVQSFNVPRALAWAQLRGSALPQGITKEEHAARVADMSRMLSSLTGPDVSTIDLAPAILDAPQRGLLTAAGTPAYFDGGHVSVAGTSLLRPLLEPLFEAGFPGNDHIPRPTPEP